MEEKARIYDDLKSGMYLAEGSDEDEAGGFRGDEYLSRLRRKEREGLVDFDRKWGDAERDEDVDVDAGDGEGNDNESIISYEDELGRTRHGTRAEAAQASNLKTNDSGADGGSERWRPSRPDNLIYGPTVQSHAFNPDTSTTSQMEYLAARRDRSPTPPEETHYDPDAEVRTRGTGFYAFSKDEAVRRKQMEELLSVREQTEKERVAKSERRAKRERAKDERRKKIEELRTRRAADSFLAGLGDLGGLEGRAGVETDA